MYVIVFVCRLFFSERKIYSRSVMLRSRRSLYPHCPTASEGISCIQNIILIATTRKKYAAYPGNINKKPAFLGLQSPASSPTSSHRTLKTNLDSDPDPVDRPGWICFACIWRCIFCIVHIGQREDIGHVLWYEQYLVVSWVWPPPSPPLLPFPFHLPQLKWT